MVGGLDTHVIRCGANKLADARAASTVVSWTTGRRRAVVPMHQGVPWHRLPRAGSRAGRRTPAPVRAPVRRQWERHPVATLEYGWLH